MKLVSLMKEYLENIKYSVKTRTFLGYKNIFELYLLSFCKHLDTDDIDSNQLSELFKESFCSRRLSASTLNLIKGQLNRGLLFGERKGLIKHLCIDMKIKQQKNTIDVLTDSEIEKLERYILSTNNYFKYGVLIALYSGLRIGELLALKWDNVDFENKVIKIDSTALDIIDNHKLMYIEDLPKTNTSIRELPITKNLYTILKNLKKHQGKNYVYVVAKCHNKRTQIRSYQECWKRLLGKLNIPYRKFHSLRHTFATRCNRYGMDIKTLSELLGHSSPSITLKVYVHTNIDMKRESLERVNKKIRKIS